jgi:3-hydroxymyristoyl/3-hydroxydecanoyl-(acyl carrier protein) dehydratase
LGVARFTLAVAADHPAFEGHFPGHPVLPGVVLLAEVVAAAERLLGLPADRLLIKVAKFHAPVPPGACLEVELAAGPDIAFAISCGATRVATGNLAAQ